MDQSTADAITRIEEQLASIIERIDVLEAQVTRILAALKAFQAASITP